MINNLIKQLNNYPANHYWVGFSGGRDSHVLLDMLVQLRDKNKLHCTFSAIHVNHNLHHHADDWVWHCQAICAKYDVHLIIETITDKPKASDSIEAFAREARYTLIQQHICNNDMFLSAHHQRDQAETFILQLMRGAGLDGLRSMPVIREFGGGTYLRPLLGCCYSDIVEYAKANSLSYINDDSNDDTRFDRNFIRHEVLPILTPRFPQASANIAQSARWLSEVPVMKAPESLVIVELLQLEKHEKKQSIRSYVKAKIHRSLSHTQTNYILTHHLLAKKDKHPTLEVCGYVIRRHNGEICVTKNIPDLSQSECNEVKIGKDYSLNNIMTLSWQCGAGIDVHENLTIQPLNGSERFHPHTRSKATSVKKCLSEAKIPVWLRQYYFGLYIDNQLIAIPNVGVDKNHYKKNENAWLPQWLIPSEFVKI